MINFHGENPGSRHPGSAFLVDIGYSQQPIFTRREPGPVENFEECWILEKAEMAGLTDQDHEEFAQWFSENTDIPEGVEPFETMEDGTYAWQETREGLARWLDIKKSEVLAHVETGTARLGFRMPMHWILAEDGKTPIQTNDILAWGDCMADKKRQVGWDYDNDKGITVSTVFLGLDHNFLGDRPVLFETMIFSQTGNHTQQRYCTWEEAERGHQVACEVAGIQRKLTTWIDGDNGESDDSEAGE